MRLKKGSSTLDLGNSVNLAILLVSGCSPFCLSPSVPPIATELNEHNVTKIIQPCAELFQVKVNEAIVR